MHLLGLLTAQSGNLPQPVPLFERALAATPKKAEIHLNYGNVLTSLGDTENALRAFDRAHRLEPRRVEILCNRAALLRAMNRLAEALESYDAALRLDKHVSAAHSGRSMVLCGLTRYEEAFASSQRALRTNPDSVDGYTAQGVVWTCRREPARAVASYTRALQLDPHARVPRSHRAVAAMLLGDYAQGWEDFDARWTDSSGSTHAAGFGTQRPAGPPTWTGHEDLTGRRLLVFAEQGLGDSLQFARYVPIVAALGAFIVLHVPAALVRLLGSLERVVESVSQGKPAPKADYQISLMSLPWALMSHSQSYAALPAGGPYLRAPVADIVTSAERLGERKNLRVGLVGPAAFGPISRQCCT